MNRLSELLSKNSSLIFLLLFGALFVIYDLQGYYQYGPYSRHQYRQADCLSFAKVYNEDNAGFFEPGVLNLDLTGTGKTVSEFPILYYTYGKLWSVFGQHEWIARAINTLIVFLGLFSLHLLLRRVLNDSFLATIIPLMYFTSPIVVYYTNSFIADAPALGLALCGWYQLYSYYESGKNSRLYLGQFFFLMAGLIKISALYSWIALMGVFAIDCIYALMKRPTLFRHHLRIAGSSFVLLAIIALWYSWSIHYNRIHPNHMFLQGILPVWTVEAYRMPIIWTHLRNEILSSAFSPKALLAVALLFGILIAMWKQTGRFLREMLLFSFFGLVMFFVLFFSVFDVHDYYLVNMTILIVMVLSAAAIVATKNYPVASRSVYSRVIIVVIFIFMVNDCRVHMMHRLDYDRREEQLDLYTLEPIMRDAGIGFDDHIIVIPDNSINIGLYYSGSKGINDFSSEINSTALESEKKRINAKYLVALNDTIVAARNIESQLGNVVLTHGRITVYRLK